MADGSFPTLVSKDTSSNAVANPIWVELTDGSNAIGVTSNALDVNIASGTVSITVPYSYQDDTAFAFTTDEVAAIGAVYDDTATNVITENNVAHVRMTGKAILLTTIADPTTDSQRLAIDANGKIGVSSIPALTLASDSVKVSGNSTANSITNPIYVQTVKTGVTATEIHDYGTGTGNTNNDYTVTGTTFLLQSVIFGASGGMKAEIQVGPLATLATKAVGFIPHQGGTQQLFFDPPIEVPSTSTGTVRVIMTNREGSAMDVYSTIIGNDIP